MAKANKTPRSVRVLADQIGDLRRALFEERSAQRAFATGLTRKYGELAADGSRTLTLRPEDFNPVDGESFNVQHNDDGSTTYTIKPTPAKTEAATTPTQSASPTVPPQNAAVAPEASA